MKKILILIAFVLFLTSIVAHRSFALQNIQLKDADYAKDMYTPAFPLIFEDLEQKVVKRKVELVGFHSFMIDILHSLETPKNRLSEDFYYKIIAKKTPSYKKRIEKDIKEKFNEKSSILDLIEWEPPCEDEIILYSMVKKDVEFLKPFEIPDPMGFNGSKEEFKYFGSKDKSAFYKTQIKPLFYKDENNYAISLNTKSGDEVILYRTETDLDKKSVHKLWSELKGKTKPDNFKKDDKFFAPFINIKELINYDELSEKEIKGTDYKIKKAIESVEFSLDNKGAKLKNEAIMSLETCALMPEIQERHFYFNKPFVLFMKEKERENPYFMAKIKDAKYLLKK